MHPKSFFVSTIVNHFSHLSFVSEVAYLQAMTSLASIIVIRAVFIGVIKKKA